MIVQSNLDDFGTDRATFAAHMMAEGILPAWTGLPVLHTVRSGGSTLVSAMGAVDLALLERSRHSAVVHVAARIGAIAPAWRGTAETMVRLALWGVAGAAAIRLLRMRRPRPAVTA